LKILLTGASSFTGMHFARALADAGHDLTCTLTKGLDDYSGVRRQRVDRLPGNLAFYTTFGSPRFMRLVADNSFDILCHHGANAADYASPDFDVPGAIQLNTNNGREVVRLMAGRGLKQVVVTGSVAEPDEANGVWRALYPYGIAKAATGMLFRHWCREFGVNFGRFVVPNPFGPYEDYRLCRFMITTWRNGGTVKIATPAYVRDFIHVDLLAKVYADQFVGKIVAPVCRPGGYAESVGDFAKRCSIEIGLRLGIRTEVELIGQENFPEPAVRVNGPRASHPLWSERGAWDAMAGYYS
jgi:nucleoside-diphosphate-sugar epimerase